MSQKSISAVYHFYHNNHEDGEYNIRYNYKYIGTFYVRFHYQSDKWVIIIDLPDDVDEKVFDTNGKISYNKSSNILEIEQYDAVVEIFS